MVRQSSVGSPKNGASKGVGLGRCCCIATVLIFGLVFMPTGKAPPSLNDNLRTGQAHKDVTKTTSGEFSSNSEQQENAPVVRQDEDNDQPVVAEGGSAEDVEEVSVEIANAKEEIEKAEKDELDKSQTVLDAAINTAGDYMRVGLSKWFGSGSGAGGGSVVNEEEIDKIVQDVEDRLSKETIQEIKEEADKEVANSETRLQEMAINVGDVTTVEDARGDIGSVEDEAIFEVKHKIDSRTDDLRKHMREKAMEVEKEILEERLSAKLGKKVKLVIENDEISGVDDLLEGLDNLSGGKKSSNSNYNSYSSSSSGTKKKKKTGDSSATGSSSSGQGKSNSYGSSSSAQGKTSSLGGGLRIRTENNENNVDTFIVDTDQGSPNSNKNKLPATRGRVDSEGDNEDGDEEEDDGDSDNESKSEDNGDEGADIDVDKDDGGKKKKKGDDDQW